MAISDDIDLLGEIESVVDVTTREEQRKDAERLRRWYEEQTKDDIIFVMSYQAGRRFVYSILAFAGMWSSSYLNGDREDTFFREGGRNVALRIWAQLQEVCPHLALKMQEENSR